MGKRIHFQDDGGKNYYVKTAYSWLVRDYKSSDPGRTVIKENAGLFSLSEALKALAFVNTFDTRRGYYKIVHKSSIGNSEE